MITSKILKLYENVWLVEYITPGRLLRTCCPSPPGAGMNTRAFLTSEKKQRTLEMLEINQTPRMRHFSSFSFHDRSFFLFWMISDVLDVPDQSEPMKGGGSKVLDQRCEKT